MIKPQRAVVLSPEKSLRYQISSDLRRMVPVSIGAKDFLELVNAPAALKSFEKYFLGLGKNLHPEDIKMHIERAKIHFRPLNTLNFFDISRFQWVFAS